MTSSSSQTIPSALGKTNIIQHHLMNSMFTNHVVSRKNVVPKTTPHHSLLWLEARQNRVRSTGFGHNIKYRGSIVVGARPLSWEIPKIVFPRPPNLFPRPERLLGGETFKDFILKQGEAVKEYPWEYAILLSIVALVLIQVFVSRFNGTVSLNSQEEYETDEEEIVPRQPITKEDRAYYALKKAEFQSEQNRSLLILGLVTALSLWLAGFLNTPHPFEP